MKLGILLSGGKDSIYAAYLAAKKNKLVCAITVRSKNKESYMFHTPNIDLVTLQAKSMNLPLVLVETEGEKEKELKQLKEAIVIAKEKYGIKGVVTGAVASQYQASRIQTICYELDLWCFNPLWQINQIQLLEELLKHQFEVIIGGVFAYPFTKKMLGKIITKEVIEELKQGQEKFQINPAGEGGEIETFVSDCPLFEKKIKINKTKIEYDNYAGIYQIEEAELVNKKQQEQQVNTQNNNNTSTTDNANNKQNNKNKTNENKENKTKRNKITTSNILIISTNSSELKLFEDEFIRPIIDILKNTKKTFSIIQLAELTGNEKAKKIIITGTGLKDNSFLKYKNIINKLLKQNNFVLGICAGAELILPDNHKLETILEIGPQYIEELNENELTKKLDGKQVYFLHQQGLRAIPFTSPLQGLLATKKGIAAFKYKDKEIYGVQFHPEVDAKNFLKKFIYK